MYGGEDEYVCPRCAVPSSHDFGPVPESHREPKDIRDCFGPRFKDCIDAIMLDMGIEDPLCEGCWVRLVKPKASELYRKRWKHK